MIGSERYNSTVQPVTAEHIGIYQQLKQCLQEQQHEEFYKLLVLQSDLQKKATLSIGEYSEGDLNSSLLMEALLKGNYEAFYLIAQYNGENFLKLITGKTCDFDGQQMPFGISDRAFKNADTTVRKEMLDKVAPQMQGVKNILDYINNNTSATEKNAIDLVGIATFFSYSELVSELIDNPSVDLNQLASRNKPAVTHAAANLDFRGEVLEHLINAKRIILDGTGVGQYQLTNLGFKKFQEFMVAYADKFTTKEFNNVSAISMCFNPENTMAEGMNKFEFLIDKKLIDVSALKLGDREELDAQVSCLKEFMDAELYSKLVAKVYPQGYVDWVVSSLNPKNIVSYLWQPKAVTDKSVITGDDEVDSFVLIDATSIPNGQMVSVE